MRITTVLNKLVGLAPYVATVALAAALAVIFLVPVGCNLLRDLSPAGLE